VTDGADGSGRPARRFAGPALRGSLIAGLVALFLDRGHKFVQLELLGWRVPCPPPETSVLCPVEPVTPFFSYMLVWNPGISYGLLQGVPPLGLLALMGLATGMLAWWWFKADTVLTRYGLAIAIGGALSHIVDRIFYGAVPDFFFLHWQAWSFYVFNISDTAITIGVILLLADMVLPQRRASA
jgi:signal peptidase II